MKSFLKGTVVLAVGLVSAMYLLNVGMGFIELIPDNVPLVGNLDELTASILLLNCLAYFGLDLTKFISLKKDVSSLQPNAPSLKDNG